MANELFQAIEEEIYPERKKGNSGSGWIWLLVIVGVVAVGVIGLILYRNKQRNKK